MKNTIRTNEALNKPTFSKIYSLKMKERTPKIRNDSNIDLTINHCFLAILTLLSNEINYISSLETINTLS